MFIVIKEFQSPCAGCCQWSQFDIEFSNAANLHITLHHVSAYEGLIPLWSIKSHGQWPHFGCMVRIVQKNQVVPAIHLEAYLIQILHHSLQRFLPPDADMLGQNLYNIHQAYAFMKDAHKHLTQWKCSISLEKFYGSLNKQRSTIRDTSPRQGLSPSLSP